MKLSNVPVGKMLAVVFSATLLANLACAAELKKGNSKSAALTQSYNWYDGDREQKVWLNPHIVAEFNPGTLGVSSVKSASPTARVFPMKHSQSSVRLWQLGDSSVTAARSLRSIHPQGQYSPVLHDGPSSGGRMRALPGNIIVYLDPAWDEAAVNNWLSTHRLEVVKKLEIGPNIYVIKTGPGLEAIEIANTLYRSGEVKAAFPDWWQEVTTR